MKEARIDEVLESVANTTLVYLPSEPLFPSEVGLESGKFKEKLSTYY